MSAIMEEVNDETIKIGESILREGILLSEDLVEVNDDNQAPRKKSLIEQKSNAKE